MESEDLLWIYQEIFTEEAYLGKGFLQLDDSTKTVLDCGANIGLFSLWVFLRSPNATIYQFEPIPHTFNMLERNMKKHNVSGRVRGYNIGLAEFPTDGSPQDREVDFRFYPEVSTMSTSLWNEKQDLLKAFVSPDVFNNYETMRCKVRCLGDIIKEEQISKIDFLKIDVEGSEVDLLNGLYEEDWIKIQQVSAEVQPAGGKIEKCITILKDHGFETSVSSATEEHPDFANVMVNGRKPKP